MKSDGREHKAKEKRTMKDNNYRSLLFSKLVSTMEIALDNPYYFGKIGWHSQSYRFNKLNSLSIFIMYLLSSTGSKSSHK